MTREDIYEVDDESSEVQALKAELANHQAIIIEMAKELGVQKTELAEAQKALHDITGGFKRGDKVYWLGKRYEVYTWHTAIIDRDTNEYRVGAHQLTHVDTP